MSKIALSSGTTGTATFTIAAPSTSTDRVLTLPDVSGTPLVNNNNLLDLNNIATARTNLGLGSAATMTGGTGANNLLQLDSSGKIPVIDGSQITNLSIQTASSSTYCNLRITNTGLSAITTVTADEIVVKNGSGGYKTLTAVSTTSSTALTGAGGLDTGTIAVSTFYSLWVIYNPTTTTISTLLSLSATSPTLPTGYTYYKRIGWIVTDTTANKYPLHSAQVGKKFLYIEAATGNVTGTGTKALAIVVNTASGWGGPASISGLVPTTAYTTWFYVYCGNNTLGLLNMNSGNVQYSPTCYFSVVSAAYMMRDLFTNGGTNIYYYGDGGGITVCLAGWEDEI